MENKKYLSIQELADIQGISRIAVYKKVKAGKIKAIKIGRNYAIQIDYIMGKKLRKTDEEKIEKAVKKTIHDYKETLRLLGKE